MCASQLKSWDRLRWLFLCNCANAKSCQKLVILYSECWVVCDSGKSVLDLSLSLQVSRFFFMTAKLILTVHMNSRLSEASNPVGIIFSLGPILIWGFYIRHSTFDENTRDPPYHEKGEEPEVLWIESFSPLFLSLCYSLSLFSYLHLHSILSETIYISVSYWHVIDWSCISLFQLYLFQPPCSSLLPPNSSLRRSLWSPKLESIWTSTSCPY